MGKGNIILHIINANPSALSALMNTPHALCAWRKYAHSKPYTREVSENDTDKTTSPYIQNGAAKSSTTTASDRSKLDATQSGTRVNPRAEAVIITSVI